MTMQGHFLSEIGTDLLRRNDPVPEALPMVLMGKDAVDSEINANRSAVSVRSLPLYDNNGRTGAIILCRDVTELRRREVELQTKNATISEIHHRVKNNLQAVSALLRLQARKTKSSEVKKELEEAQRRVQTIAMVHEGLSQTADEIVDFDKVISNLLKMSVDLARCATSTSTSITSQVRHDARTGCDPTVTGAHRAHHQLCGAWFRGTQGGAYHHLRRAQRQQPQCRGGG